MYKSFTILLLSFLGSCSSPTSESAAVRADAKAEQSLPAALNSLTQAHQITKFHQKEVVTFDLELYFGDKLRLAGTIYSRTNSTAVIVEKSNGSQLFFDGKEVYISSDTANVKGARFDALTWSYFALAPFKFKDAGTNWAENGPLPFDSVQATYPSLKLTFGANVGDAPDDWYIIFQEEETGLLKAMAYIVTFGDTPQEEAAKNPHAIVYSDYELVDGIPFATTWKFHNWNVADGLGSQLGEAHISNIKFTNEADSLFVKSQNYKLVPLK
jgi:hypothetical protein